MKLKITIFCFFITFSLASIANVDIIFNINGDTINNGEHISFKAMAFAKGRVLALDTKTNLLDKYPDAHLIDGKNKYILPGLHDAHGHVMGLARLKNEINLMSVTSVAESLQIIQKFIDEHPQSNWILGRGWNQVLWEGKQFPSYKDLDTLKTDKPIWLRRVDGHAGWANSKAMEIARTSSHLKDMPGGEILLNQQGVQSGIFIDNAMNLIESHINREGVSNNEKLVSEALNYLASLGITAVDDAGIDWPTYDAYKSLTAKNKLPIRINAMLASNSQVIDKMLADGTYKDDFLQIQTIKYILDGALGSRGAAMLAPYNDRRDSSGKLVQSQAFIENLIYNNVKGGWQAAIHAIGDKANRIALKVLSDEKAHSQQLRHRIEHAQIVAFNDLNKFKQFHIIASMQPTHATSDMNMAEDRVGRERLRGAYAWQTMLKKGINMASGSDFPVELANPFYGLHAAVTRQDRNNQPMQGWIAIEKMTVDQALASFTIGAAYANHQEQKLGSLEVGKWADFIVVDQNIFKIAAKDIWRTQVLQTWVAGKNIYTNPKTTAK
jgi:predicted amidohydrolase YtcJ